jgi:transcriptional regulator with XRE-family HTH domain
MLRCMPVTTGTPKARALGAELRRVRERAGLGVRELARQLNLDHVDHSALSRFERGERSPKPEDVATILGVLGVNGDERDRILGLSRDPDGPVWLAVTIPERQQQLAALLEFERTATAVTEVSPLLVPGLLQTADYARAIMVTGKVPAREIDTRVAVRVGRREALTRRNPVHLTALLGEPVLRQMIGDRQVMADQLAHLLRLAELPAVDLRIVPLSSGWHPGLEGPFSVHEFAKATPVVHLEVRESSLYLHQKADVAAYQDAAAEVLRVAMSADDSAALVAREAELIERMA